MLLWLLFGEPTCPSTGTVAHGRCAAQGPAKATLTVVAERFRSAPLRKLFSGRNVCSESQPATYLCNRMALFEKRKSAIFTDFTEFPAISQRSKKTQFGRGVCRLIAASEHLVSFSFLRKRSATTVLGRATLVERCSREAPPIV